MTADYVETIALLERLHRQALDLVKAELERLAIHDLNAVQAFILYNIGEHELSVGELMQRGYYQGSNVSYNVRKMQECGYLHQSRSRHDRRSVKLRLSAKGKALRERLEVFFKTLNETLQTLDLGACEPEDLNTALDRLEAAMRPTERAPSNGARSPAHRAA